MPIMQMPDGSFANIADGTPPDVIARIQSSFKATAGAAGRAAASKPAAPDPGQQYDADIQRRIQQRDKFGGRTFGGTVVNDLTFGLMDKFDAALGAGLNRLRGKGTSFSDEYQREKAAIQQQAQQYDEDHSILAPVAHTAGMLMAPVPELGITAKIGKVAGGSNRLALGVAKLLDTGVGRGLTTGAKMGVMQGVADSVDDPSNMYQNAKNEAISGALGGALFGGAMGGATKFGHILADRAEGNAGRTAYSKIADALDRSVNPATGKPYSALTAINEIKATDRGGGDAMLADLSPELRNMAGYLASRPGMRAANQIEQRVQDRFDAGGDRFAGRVRSQFGNAANPDAYTAAKDIRGNLKNMQTEGYSEGGMMDKPLKWTPELDEFFRTAPKETMGALRNAYDEMLLRRENPAAANPLVQISKLHADPNAHIVPVPASGGRDPLPGLPGSQMPPKPGMEGVGGGAFVAGTPAIDGTTKLVQPHVTGNPNGTFDAVPTLRTFDYMKRGFDKQIGMALKSGDRTTAQGLSKELGNLKAILAKDNPEYASFLSQQHDEYQRLNALELGQKIPQMMRNGQSREALDAMKAMAGQHPDIRTGFVDGLMQLREKSDNPVRAFRAMMRSPDQRAAMLHLFGDNKSLVDFERFMRREIRTRRADDIINPTHGSKTNVLRQQGEPDEMQASALVGKSALQGYAFGGPAGLASRVLRSFDTLSSGLGPKAQEELARILMGKGDGLQSGIMGAKKFQQQRTAQSKMLTSRAARVGSGFTRGFAQE